jgi:uncharacterized protein HemY
MTIFLYVLVVLMAFVISILSICCAKRYDKGWADCERIMRGEYNQMKAHRDLLQGKLNGYVP